MAPHPRQPRSGLACPSAPAQRAPDPPTSAWASSQSQEDVATAGIPGSGAVAPAPASSRKKKSSPCAGVRVFTHLF